MTVYLGNNPFMKLYVMIENVRKKFAYTNLASKILPCNMLYVW